MSVDFWTPFSSMSSQKTKVCVDYESILLAPQTELRRNIIFTDLTTILWWYPATTLPMCPKQTPYSRTISTWYEMWISSVEYSWYAPTGPGHPCGCAWWRHQMETFSALQALCAGNSPVHGEFSAQRPVTRSFEVFFDLHLNKQLSEQSRSWRFETPSGSLWRQCNGMSRGTPW